MRKNGTTTANVDIIRLKPTPPTNVKALMDSGESDTNPHRATQLLSAVLGAKPQGNNRFWSN
jgi:hypothetical protein